MDAIDVLIDTDNALGTLGSDPEDGLAIVMATQSPELRVLAVTGVFGNCRIECVIANTTMLLHELRRPDIPFAAGFDGPLLPGHPAGHPSPVRESDAQLVEGGARPDRHAVDVIIDTALASTTGLTLIGLGPTHEHRRGRAARAAPSRLRPGDRGDGRRAPGDQRDAGR
jgi:purine nucleosidase/pyrimidine-specific ribonucleoside hydrolase